jgi:hypothetical protein
LLAGSLARIYKENNMHYWRQDSFDKLSSLKERLAGTPELAAYVSYIEFLDRGLRQEGLKHIEDLISTLRALPLERQRHIASLLCRETEIELGHKLIPYPLERRFITPVIADWKNAEPLNPEPLRWTRDLQDLRRSMELDPSCDWTRRRLILKILGFVGFSTHELPAGYLGVVEEDYELLNLARQEALLLRDVKMRESYLGLIAEEKKEIDEYIKRKAGLS